MTTVNEDMAHKASTFYTLTQEAFHFLEEQYGYRLESTSLVGTDDFRDTVAKVVFVGEHVAVRVDWYLADAGIGVGFIELRDPGVLPAYWNFLGTDPNAPPAVTLFTLAEMQGHAQNPDFLLGDLAGTRKPKLPARERLVETNLAGILAGLAHATQRYAADILAGDTSCFPDAMRLYAQKRNVYAQKTKTGMA